MRRELANGSTARITARILPRSSRNDVSLTEEKTVRIHVTAPPVGGAANKALIKLLAGALSVPRRDIEIVAGHAGRTKVIQVSGLSTEEALGRLQGFASSN
jgi:uncharacterized protein (TIGR00251 family)